MTAPEIATKAHAGQFRNDGVTPYVTHPEKVAGHFYPETFEWEVAWLHDVLEDTSWTRDDLADEGIDSVVLDALDLLTHKKGESYGEYVWKIKVAAEHLEANLAGKIALKVKLADIATNLSDNPSAHAIKKYGKAISTLVSHT